MGKLVLFTGYVGAQQDVRLLEQGRCRCIVPRVWAGRAGHGALDMLSSITGKSLQLWSFQFRIQDILSARKLMYFVLSQQLAYSFVY